MRSMRSYEKFPNTAVRITRAYAKRIIKTKKELNEIQMKENEI